ncbi:MAG TPA: T9SS type A sorting domain-containing protein, partial [Rhodothermales bacterium]|nr:T9SS type A sorting domain-containing protein [Rhodothermales bacterium]
YTRPGGGWGTVDAAEFEPTDPVDARVYLLRKADTLWIGVRANDKSIGGAPDTNFFHMDGLVMSILDKNERSKVAYTGPNYGNGANTDEFWFSWLQTGYEPGLAPTPFGTHGDDRTMWDGKANVSGVSNDDMNGGEAEADDDGYTMEVWIDLSKLGIDMTQAEGDRLPMSIAVYDYDYAWPANPDKKFAAKAWWQNPWGGDMPHGVGFVYGKPSVTVSSGDAPDVEVADLVLASGGDATVTVDGALDEDVWTQIEPQVSLQYQMTEEELDALPGFGPYYTYWFRPGADAEGAPQVVDPSTGQFRLFFEGDTLYVGLDAADQGISGNPAESRADGFRISLRTDSMASAGAPQVFYSYWATIDSSGQVVLKEQAADNPGVTAALSLKGSSTVADASDVDEGYQIEMAIDLTTLPGLEDGPEDGIIWLGLTYFDGDYTDPDNPDDSYGTRTWFLVERGTNSAFGGPAIRTYLDSKSIVATQRETELPTRLRVLGNYPNPFQTSTRIAYMLPRAGEVTIQVSDVLGRIVATLRPGVQSAGRNEVSVSGLTLASGTYFYRVRLSGADGGTATGRMVLVK